MVLIAARVHPFPSRTRKLSSPALKILGWRRPGKIGFRQHRKTTCANRWFFCACGGQVAGRSLPLALLGVKRQLSVRGGCGGCATGMSGGARCRSLYSEKNASCLSAVVGWVYRVDGLGSSLAIGRTAAALPLGNRLLRRKIFLGFLKIPKVFLRPFFRILW